MKITHYVKVLVQSETALYFQALQMHCNKNQMREENKVREDLPSDLNVILNLCRMAQASFTAITTLLQHLKC